MRSIQNKKKRLNLQILSSIFKHLLLPILVILELISFNSCVPVIYIENQSPVLTKNSLSNDFYTFGKFEKVPADAIFICEIYTRGNFFSKAKYRLDESIDLLKEKAIDVGGNALQISKIYYPSPFGSKSYDIKAKVFYLSSPPKKCFIIVSEKYIPKIGNTILKISRNNQIYGSGNSYPLYLNGEFVCSLDVGESIKIELSSRIT